MYNQQAFREIFQHHLLLRYAQIELRLQRATGLDGRLFCFAQHNKQLPAQGDPNCGRIFAGKSRGVCVYVQEYGRLTMAKMAKGNECLLWKFYPCSSAGAGIRFLVDDAARQCLIAESVMQLRCPYISFGGR